MPPEEFPEKPDLDHTQRRVAKCLRQQQDPLKVIKHLQVYADELKAAIGKIPSGSAESPASSETPASVTTEKTS